MNIVLYLKNLQGRGVQKVYLNLAKGLQELGCSVYFVIRENKIELDNKFLKHFYIFENIEVELDNLLSSLLNPILISNDVKITLNLKNINSKNIYYTVHMLWGERIFKQLRFLKWFELKQLYKNKQLIAVSDAVKKDLLTKVGIEPKSIEVIFDGFDIESIKKLANEPIDLSSDYMLNIGALSQEKNHKLLLRSYAKLNSPLDLIIIGSGKLEKSLKSLAKKLSIENKVHFVGFKSNPYPYIKNAKLVISTSTNEALPGVIIESLILNTPVVSTQSKGVSSILNGNLSPFVVKNSKLIEAISKALKNYPSIKVEDYDKFCYKKIASCYVDYISRRKNDE
ncbi:MAG: hypothetical protein KN64_09950 [Sulfurovum sp. AS07-7]|nr:MAG: hypothetical protein KN64_09950 [Sulfurovum sp. AS07-7]